MCEQMRSLFMHKLLWVRDCIKVNWYLCLLFVGYVLFFNEYIVRATIYVILCHFNRNCIRFKLFLTVTVLCLPKNCLPYSVLISSQHLQMMLSLTEMFTVSSLLDVSIKAGSTDTNLMQIHLVSIFYQQNTTDLTNMVRIIVVRVIKLVNRHYGWPNMAVTNLVSPDHGWAWSPWSIDKTRGQECFYGHFKK